MTIQQQNILSAAIQQRNDQNTETTHAQDVFEVFKKVAIDFARDVIISGDEGYMWDDISASQYFEEFASQYNPQP